MTNTQKLIMLQTILDDGTGAMPSDEKLNTYLDIAASEILAWQFHLVGGVPDGITAVPSKYDGIHVYAVVAGFTQAGAEGEAAHIENGVHRNFRYSDMMDYIHNNVLPYVRVGAVT